VVLAMLASALVISGGNAAAAAPAPTRLHTSGSQILDAANKPVRIRAVNWFGMETSNCAPHGLWTISLDAGMAQIAGFGFNTIRLPFSNQCIDQTAPVSGIDVTRNPTLQNKTPLQIMDAVIASAKAHGLQVILDQHRPDSGSQSELWYTPAYPESKWIADWVTLAKRYANNPAVIGADLHNEPHASACWGCGDPARDWAAAATRAGNAVLAADPKLLILVEGIEQQGNGSSTWWGGGLSDAAAHPISLAVAHQLVYSPHDYPASIYNQTWFSAPNYPANLPGVWDRNWGYLQKNNIAPVLLGEFGTKLETTSDQKWLQSMVGYLNATGMSFAYWSFNPNSGDTGGLVKDDWTTPQTAKLAALKPLFAPGTAVVASPVTPSPTKPTKPTTPPKPTTVRPSPAGAAVQATWTLQSAWNAGYVADFMVTAKSKVSTWTVSWPDAGATSVVNAWGLRCTVGGGRITCRSAGWATAIGGGGSVRVGLQVAGNGRAPSNPAISIS
jgi:endoglucanase